MENPRPPARSYGVSRDHASFCFWGGGDGLGDLGGAVGAAEFDGLGAAGFGGLGQAEGGGGEPAGGAVLAGVADGVQVGFVGQAAVHHVGAAGVEGAAGRQPDQAGRLAGDRAEPLGGGRGAGDGLEQALGVGVVGLVEDVALGGLLSRAVSESCCSRSSRSRIWAWTVASSAVVGSSAMISLGFSEIAIAIMARWRMPPENWCG